MTQAVGVGLLFLSGCDALRSARDDIARLADPTPPPQQVRKTNSSSMPRPPSPPPAPAPAASMRGGSAASPVEASAAAVSAEPSAAADTTDRSVVLPTGTSERDLRAMLGSPTSEEEHPPGKQWRYRDGKCTIDIQLYPDVETKQFATLAYKVKSDDNTDEGRRLCVAQLQSRVQARR
ncbi:MAG: hypothetical protein IKE60_21100 [Reyranella sp.]|jgi:hypothetical protein|uniref:hypothetical protein n=1 Tax=Reyranella sp. TaxID=1929291 RepID=UPI001AD5E144|nr:hypothetical protein [Reyranella sp.]MBN9541272.1 hypothetical protein [Alphaproteobacteria bacterium]MBR2817169.1 hypothetical protein [Reyranella sp.]